MKLLPVSIISDVSRMKTNVTDSFHRLLNTWKSYDGPVRKLLLAIIKSEIQHRVGGIQLSVEIESTEPCRIVEGDTYLQELESEFRDSSTMLDKLPGSDSIGSSQSQGVEKIPKDRLIPIAGTVTDQILADLEEENNATTEVDETDND